jgi:hypothetical protein
MAVVVNDPGFAEISAYTSSNAMTSSAGLVEAERVVRADLAWIHRILGVGSVRG